MRILTQGRTRLAALAAASCLLLTGCDFSVYSLPLPGGADVGDNPYEITVEFRDVLDLVPQSAVKVDDVSVGRVEDVELDGYAAKVTLLLNRSVKLPGNAIAEIRQTSLLGEKFVSLSPPPNPSSDTLGDGDTIGLDRSGRNTEVEEVLGALSLILNGGGVGQLKTITVELNKALDGHEDTARSVLSRLNETMGQLDGGKTKILDAIDRVNSLAVELNKHTGDLDLALKELPSAIQSLDGQRDDLVKMLRALANLSSVGTRVIQASKQGTIESLNSLAPVLSALAKSGDDLANSLQIVLTFPFMDAIVGKNPQQARDLHMGDYTNLNATLDLNLETILGGQIPGLPGGPTAPGLPSISLPGLPSLDLPTVGLPGSGGGGLLGGGGNGGGNGGGGNGGNGGGGGGGLLGGGGPLGNRAAVGDQSAAQARADRKQQAQELSELAGLLGWGVLHR
jgi:phospholipid/cholesterol/gamma-HCH transport system substrate-binding protein